MLVAAIWLTCKLQATLFKAVNNSGSPETPTSEVVLAVSGTWFTLELLEPLTLIAEMKMELHPSQLFLQLQLFLKSLTS